MYGPVDEVKDKTQQQINKAHSNDVNNHKMQRISFKYEDSRERTVTCCKLNDFCNHQINQWENKAGCNQQVFLYPVVVAENCPI